MDMLISSAVTGKLTYHKKAVISCHIRERGSNRKKFSFDPGQMERQNASAGVELRFEPKKISLPLANLGVPPLILGVPTPNFRGIPNFGGTPYSQHCR